MDDRPNEPTPAGLTVAPSRISTLRRRLAWGALSLLVLYGLLLLGALDSLVKQRARHIAQRDLMASEGNRWFGIECWQYPDDLMLYQEVLFETRPDAIIETGTFHGGLTIYLATLLELVNPDAEIVSIDLDCSRARASLDRLDLPGRERIKRRIHLVQGWSTDPETIEQVKQRVKDRQRILVILDADHSKEGVLKELTAYAPMVSPNGYIIVNDTHLDRYLSLDEGGPLAAVRAFLKANPQFQIDTSRHKFLVSCAPDGFLKRVK